MIVTIFDPAQSGNPGRIWTDGATDERAGKKGPRLHIAQGISSPKTANA